MSVVPGGSVWIPLGCPILKESYGQGSIAQRAALARHRKGDRRSCSARACKGTANLGSDAGSSRGQAGVQECHYIVIIYTVAIINFIFHLFTFISVCDGPSTTPESYLHVSMVCSCCMGLSST